MELNADFFKKVLEHSHDEIYVCDGTGIALYCNKRFEINYGIKREDMIGKQTSYLVEQGYSNNTPVPDVIAMKKVVTSLQQTAIGKFLMVTATPYFDENGDIEFIIENCRDITELEMLKGELTEQKLELARMAHELQKKPLQKGALLQDFSSPAMTQVEAMIKKVAPTDVTVLIQGESGTGKTYIANAIHKESKRSSRPFISINCSSIPDSLFESEFFGYTSGAFTGAKSKGKTGLIELANGGTLFLDEVGEIPLQLQGKLLHVIQEKKFTPVGGIKEKNIDIRIIAATNQPLEKRIKEQSFREDLFYRLNVVSLTMPALRQRKEDITILTAHFLNKYSDQYKRQHFLSPQVLNYFANYTWPGNIRELENLIQHLVVMASNEEISLIDLPTKMVIESDELPSSADAIDFNHLMEQYERSLLEESLRFHKSSYKVASHLNISQTKASRLLRKHHLNSKE